MLCKLQIDGSLIFSSTRRNFPPSILCLLFNYIKALRFLVYGAMPASAKTLPPLATYCYGYCNPARKLASTAADEIAYSFSCLVRTFSKASALYCDGCLTYFKACGSAYCEDFRLFFRFPRFRRLLTSPGFLLLLVIYCMLYLLDY